MNAKAPTAVAQPFRAANAAGPAGLKACATFPAAVIAVLFATLASLMSAQGSDEATRMLQEYVRIDTSNPPGDTRKAADFLAAIFKREGITDVTRYESAPGKAIIYARLKASVSPPAGKPIVLLNHMDVVPADRRRPIAAR